MKFFSLDSPVMVFLTKMANLMILNLLTIMCCIPVVTAGAAITAMYYVTLKMARGEDPYIVKNYFKAFVQNFKQSTIVWLLLIVVSVALFLDWKILSAMELSGGLGKAAHGILIAIIIIVCIVTMYVFPMISRFENKISVTLRNSLLMSIVGLPRTVLIVLIHMLPIALIMATEMATPLMLLLGFATVAYLSSTQFVKIFKPFEPQEEPAPAEDEYVPLPFMVEEEEARKAEAEARRLQEESGINTESVEENTADTTETE